MSWRKWSIYSDTAYEMMDNVSILLLCFHWQKSRALNVIHVYTSVDLDDLSISARIAPRNGGLVCFKDRAQNSLHCGVRCNDGYEHPSSLHDYESIGPATAYEWSFQRTAAEPTMRYPSCVGTSDTNTKSTLIYSLFHFARIVHNTYVPDSIIG